MIKFKDILNELEIKPNTSNRWLLNFLQKNKVEFLKQLYSEHKLMFDKSYWEELLKENFEMDSDGNSVLIGDGHDYFAFFLNKDEFLKDIEPEFQSWYQNNKIIFKNTTIYFTFFSL